MRVSRCCLYKIPKNMGVAPRFDIWNEKYEPWEHMKRMGRLAGTGFYIPPEWYNHFRMFPPINHNFQQEKTLNPQNRSEPTQDDTSHLSAERIALRETLANKSRLVASEGMRYYNIFWVRKPLDRMEKEYYSLKRKGVGHDDAIKRVLAMFYEELAAKKRVAAIQSEEAKLSGRFITMREAAVVMNVLTQLHREQLTPHQVSLLAQEQQALATEGGSVEGSLVRRRSRRAGAAGEGEEAGEGGDGRLSASDLADELAEGSGEVTYEVKVTKTPYDSVKQMQEAARDQSGKTDWYTGASPVFDLSPGGERSS